MNNAPIDEDPESHGSLPTDVDEACDHFELSWQRGQQPRIENYIAAVSETDRVDLLGELLVIELHWRRQFGQRPTIDEYRRRFSQAGEAVDAAFAGPPSVTPLASSTQAAVSPVVLNLRCPHCLNRIELVNLDPLLEVECPSCSNRFHVIGDALSGMSSQSRLARPPESIAHFDLIEPLGTGAFGSVWKARDRQLDREVALKIPRKEHLGGDEAEQFLREARAAAQLQHPGIVSIHEVGVDNDRIYIVSDLVDGLPLDQWLEENNPSRRALVEMCIQIADALHYAHQQGVVHRDLKPSNIMIDKGGVPYLMDFGLAKREAGEITMTIEGQVLGTPAYMSPEQAKGEGHAADRRSDVYSLGVVLFEMLTGERPFRGNMRMLLNQVIEDEPPAPRKLNSRIPRELETICLKCLEKSPDRRYPTASNIGEELSRHLRGEPIEARPISSTERTWRWCKRNPIVSASIGVVTLSLLAATVISTYFAIKASQRAFDEQVARRSADASAELAREEGKRADEKADEAIENMKLARLAEYSMQIRSAQSNIVQRNMGRAEQILDSCRQDNIGWEYRFLRSCCARMMQTLRHGKIVSDVQFSPDGRQIYSAGTDHTVRVWDADSGALLQTLAGHEHNVKSVAVHPTNGQIVSASQDTTLKLWNLETGTEIRSFEGHSGPVNCVVFSPDGKQLVSGSSDKLVCFWDVDTGDLIRKISSHTDAVMAVAHHPTSPWILSGGNDRSIRLWDAATGELIRKFEGNRALVRSLAFNADGSLIAVSGMTTLVGIWEVSTGSQLCNLEGHNGLGVFGVAFGSDGSQLFSCGFDQTVRVWDIATRRQLYCIKAHTGMVDCVAQCPDDVRFATGSFDGTVRIWQTERILKKSNLGIQSTPLALTIHNDGKTIASVGSDKVLRVDSADTRRVLGGHRSTATHIAFNDDGGKIVTGGWDKKVRIWDVVTGSQQHELSGHTGLVNVAYFSPDGSKVASAGGFKSLESNDNSVRIWDASTGKELVTIWEVAEASANCLAFSPDGSQVVVGTSLNSVTNWDATTGKQLRSFDGSTGPVYDIAFSPSGNRIAAVGLDAAVRVWNAQSGEPELTLTGHSDPVHRVIFSPDESRLVSATLQGELRIWHAQRGNHLLTLQLDTSSLEHITFTRDGSQLIVGTGEGSIVTLDTQPAEHTKSKTIDP